MAAAFAAYALWGLSPLYFKLVGFAPATVILGHRVIWSAVLAMLLVALAGRTHVIWSVFRDRKRLIYLAASSLCLSANWGFFIWAVNAGHALEVSLGYFINPLCSVLLGVLFLHERLSGRQLAALGLVSAGVAILALGAKNVAWLCVIFPTTFAFYPLLRKMVAVDALVGMAVETLLVAPLAIVYLAMLPTDGVWLDGGGDTVLLLMAAGPVTALPLVLFAYGARRLTMISLGLMQYINPTLQMGIAVLIFGEAFTPLHALTFAFIWAGLALYSVPARHRAQD
jgi:chloramphenicol-sensitive protein RarD